MTSDSRREAVARAICKSGKFETGEGCCAPICLESLGSARDHCRRCEYVHGDLADAALAAADAQQDTVRVPVEPTEAMEDAGRQHIAWDGFHKGEPGHQRIKMRAAYRAMIEAASAGEEDRDG